MKLPGFFFSLYSAQEKLKMAQEAAEAEAAKTPSL